MSRPLSPRTSSSSSESFKSFNTGTTYINPRSSMGSQKHDASERSKRRSGIPLSPPLKPTHGDAWVLEDVEYRSKKWHLDPAHKDGKAHTKKSSTSPSRGTRSTHHSRLSSPTKPVFHDGPDWRPNKDRITEEGTLEPEELEALRLAMLQSRKEYDEIMRRRREAELRAERLALLREELQREERERADALRRLEGVKPPRVDPDVVIEVPPIAGDATPWWKYLPDDRLKSTNLKPAEHEHRPGAGKHRSRRPSLVIDTNETYAEQRARILHQQEERERQLKLDRKLQEQLWRAKELEEEEALARALQESLETEAARRAKSAAREAARRDKKLAELRTERMRLEEEAKAVEEKIKRRREKGLSGLGPDLAKEPSRFYHSYYHDHPAFHQPPDYSYAPHHHKYPPPTTSSRGTHSSSSSFSDARHQGSRHRRYSFSSASAPSTPRTGSSGGADPYATYPPYPAVVRPGVEVDVDSLGPLPRLGTEKKGNRRWSTKTTERWEKVARWEEGADKYRQRTTTTTTRRSP
ncbi:hypothetical protein VTJ04DRAFT_10914 [Mycothermus thermophilus]|uniref:uncharacterized protein n=1 Tax=Humicola insolens TaxID=85995 RepID=UPI00374291A1